MRRVALGAAMVIAFVLLVFVTQSAALALRGDDPGPRLQYGGTPIELHFDAPGANVTKVYVDGTPCIVVSFAAGKKEYNEANDPTLALSCDWTRR